MSGTARVFEDCVGIIAYAELRGVMLGWAGVRDWTPAMRSRAAVARALDSGKSAILAIEARRILREETSAILTSSTRAAPPWPYTHLIGPGQVGSTSGLESVFHLAGTMAGGFRNSDPRVLSLAVTLTDYVRHRTG